MEWIFLVVVLWMKDGTPEPHLAVVAPDAECTEEMARQVWSYFAAMHADGEVNVNYSYSCDRAHAPDLDSQPAPHKAKRNEA